MDSIGQKDVLPEFSHLMHYKGEGKIRTGWTAPGSLNKWYIQEYHNGFVFTEFTDLFNIFIPFHWKA